MGYVNSVDWNNGMEQWSGLLEWSTGLDYCMECHAHHIYSMVTSHDCSNTVVSHSSVRTVILTSSALCYLVILVTRSLLKLACDVPYLVKS